MALNRIAVQGWSKDDAIAEMKNGGYGIGFILYGKISLNLLKI